MHTYRNVYIVRLYEKSDEIFFSDNFWFQMCRMKITCLKTSCEVLKMTFALGKWSITKYLPLTLLTNRCCVFIQMKKGRMLQLIAITPKTMMTIPHRCPHFGRWYQVRESNFYNEHHDTLGFADHTKGNTERILLSVEWNSLYFISDRSNRDVGFDDGNWQKWSLE